MGQLLLAHVVMGDRNTPAALVVFIDGARTAAAYVDGPTCLNHTAQLASMVAKDVDIALSFGHTDAKWKGRGTR